MNLNDSSISKKGQTQKAMNSIIQLICLILDKAKL